MKQRYCVCKGWKEGIQQINAQTIFCANQSAAPKYTAPVFIYCPWCGKKLSIWEICDGAEHELHIANDIVIEEE